MNRRLVVLAGAGLAAAAIGAGTAWRRSRLDAEDAVAPQVSIDLWALEFQSLEGASIRMSAWRGRPLLLNFWATWTPPAIVALGTCRLRTSRTRPRGPSTLLTS